MKLKEVAVLGTGLVLNRKEAGFNDTDTFKYKQLTLKSVNNNGSINPEYLDIFLSKEPLKDKYLTQKSDIIVRLSYPYTAILIDGQAEGIVVSSHFCIIRCDTTIILPEYLQLILNSSSVYKKISLATVSSALKVIRPSFFSELNINIIPLDKQRVLGNINNLYRKEIDLLERLKTEKQRCYSLFINKIQNEMERK